MSEKPPVKTASRLVVRLRRPRVFGHTARLLESVSIKVILPFICNTRDGFQFGSERIRTRRRLPTMATSAEGPKTWRCHPRVVDDLLWKFSDVSCDWFRVNLRTNKRTYKHTNKHDDVTENSTLRRRRGKANSCFNDGHVYIVLTVKMTVEVRCMCMSHVHTKGETMMACRLSLFHLWYARVTCYHWCTCPRGTCPNAPSLVTPTFPSIIWLRRQTVISGSRLLVLVVAMEMSSSSLWRPFSKMRLEFSSNWRSVFTPSDQNALSSFSSI